MARKVIHECYEWRLVPDIAPTTQFGFKGQAVRVEELDQFGVAASGLAPLDIQTLTRVKKGVQSILKNRVASGGSAASLSGDHRMVHFNGHAFTPPSTSGSPTRIWMIWPRSACRC